MKLPNLLAVVLPLALLPAAGLKAQNEVVAIAAQAIPPLWHITSKSNPDSEVWIIGTVGQMPRGLDWNRRAIADLLDGARAIYMPAQPDVNLIDAGWFLLWNGGKLSLPDGQKLEDILPANLRDQFVRIRTSIGRDADRYETDVPLRAAARLQGDANNSYRLSGGEPNRTIREIARSKNVPVGPVGKFEVMDLARAVIQLTPQQQLKCFSEILDDIDRLAAHADIAGRAWAAGDFRTVRDHYAEPRIYDCATSSFQQAADIYEDQIKSYVAAVYAALAKPGKTIVTIGIGPLMRDDGVLARLARYQFVIDAPPG